jgi:predicted Zn-dependent protease with MMP-like domain
MAVYDYPRIASEPMEDRRVSQHSAGMTDKEFSVILETAIRELPDEFREKLENVAIIVEDYPSEELLQRMEVPDDESLFGLYEGVPLTERGHFDAPLMPDRIYIFQREIEDACGSPQEVKKELKVTLVHEIAHFFGMDDDYLEEIGY